MSNARTMTITHRFDAWVIVANWHGYYVVEYADKDTAIEAVRRYYQHQTMYITDWRAFRRRVSCNMPNTFEAAVIGYYFPHTLKDNVVY